MAQLRFLALGDSYTIGESVFIEERWPEQLRQRLSAEYGLDVAAPVTVAKTGWTTDELAAGIDEASPKGVFDLVSLLIGVNNQYRGLPVGEYQEQFGALLDLSVRFAGGRPRNVIVVSIPDWGVTPFASGQDAGEIAHAIDRFNAVNRAEATARGVRYVDVTECSRLAKSDSSLTAADGLHPSAAMYRMWTELILPEVRGAVGD